MWETANVWGQWEVGSVSATAFLNRMLQVNTCWKVHALTTGGNECFQVLDIILLLLILLLLDDLILTYSLDEGIVVTSVVCELLLGQPDDMRTYTIQKVLQAVDIHTGQHPATLSAAHALGHKDNLIHTLRSDVDGIEPFNMQ